MKTMIFLTLVMTSTFCNAQLPIVSGWTQCVPSADSRIIYVSNADGADATAEFYSPASANIGSDPFHPSGTIRPYKTLAAAIAQLRTGYPDWILLKNGDVFANQHFGILVHSGRTRNEPMVFGAYGSSPQRPKILTGNQNGINIGYYSENNLCNYLVFLGLAFEPHTRSGIDEPTGLNIFARFNSLLVEDCSFEKYHANIVILDPAGGNGSASRRNFVVRRSILGDAYTTGSAHANGMFINNVDSILFEECLLDHNGWSKTIAGAMPTGFRHNSYFQVGNKNVMFKNNIVSRAAATGGGFRCGGIVSDNLYLSNPQNIQFGTHENTLNWPAEYVAGEVSYNVVLDARVEAFDVGRGIRIQRAKNTNVHHNIVAHFTPVGDYNIGVVVNEVDNVRISKNIVYKWGNNRTSGPAYSSGMQIGNALMGKNFVDNNDVQMENNKGYCMEVYASAANISFAANRYNNAAPANNWFQPGGNHSAWKSIVFETDGQILDIPYTDPERNIASYLTSLGENGGLEEFVEKRKSLNKSSWDNDYTASSVNNYIRSGFGMGAPSSVVLERDNDNASIYPNPNYSGNLQIVGLPNGIDEVRIFNAMGQETRRISVDSVVRVDLDISDMASGVYCVVFGNGTNQKAQILLRQQQ